MWSARRVSTVMKKMRRGGWGAGDARRGRRWGGGGGGAGDEEGLVPVSLPRQAMRSMRKAQKILESLKGTNRISQRTGDATTERSPTMIRRIGRIGRMPTPTA